MNILLVDDSDFSLSLTKELIIQATDDSDICFLLAKDGDDAVHIFRDSQIGEIDVIFMDVIMPEKNGVTALHEIRTMDRPDSLTVPIVIVSALVESSCINQTDKKLITDYIQKPLSKEKFRTFFQKL